MNQTISEVNTLEQTLLIWPKKKYGMDAWKLQEVYNISKDHPFWHCALKKQKSPEY